MIRTLLRRVLFTGLLTAGIAAGGIYGLMRAALPEFDTHYRLEGFTAPVRIEFDSLGIPRIRAATRKDAFRALGFAVARDRLFQMDLMRRQSGGRLAEVLGPAALESDRHHRIMGFERVATDIVTRLPERQKEVLEAYAGGVNQAMAQMAVLPFEFLTLGYRPQPWRPEDSLLAVLLMFDTLTGRVGDQERMATVMETALGSAVTAFLTPDSDRYADRVARGTAWRPELPVPRREWAALMRDGASQNRAGRVDTTELIAGSNGWLVAPRKTWDGRAILANDMHLELQVPNVWYRAELHIGESALSGFTLPGLPLFIAGTNRRVAWGFTNTAGDFLDLVRLETDLRQPELYRTPEGSARFGIRLERIRVRGGADVTLPVKTTLWGPVLPEPLLGQQVAVQWTALDPNATDLALLDLADAADGFEALAVLNRAGGPPLNALVADSRGNIAWTYTGKIPIRQGLDGLVSRAWTDGWHGWRGYVAADALPRIVNPPEGYLVSANQRMLGREYPHLIGQDFDSGYRAYRISERLAAMQGITERELLQLQLDAKTEFYRFYQALALQVLDGSTDPELRELRRALLAWDGHAEPNSRGLTVLADFRERLADGVFAPLVTRCAALEPGFSYRWGNIDRPLQQILNAREPELLPPGGTYRDWNGFILERLRDAFRATAGRCGPVGEQRWDCGNRVRVEHLFARLLPGLGPLLNMPEDALPGCPQCVRLAAPDIGASERLVVAPGHEENAIFHMPGGQSGQPLSPFYRNQQRLWLRGTATDLLAGETRHWLEIRPGEAKGTHGFMAHRPQGDVFRRLKTSQSMQNEVLQ